MEEYLCENPICENWNEPISESDVLLSEMGKQCPKCYQPVKTRAQIDAEKEKRKKSKIKKMIIGLIIIIVVPILIFLLFSIEKNQQPQPQPLPQEETTVPAPESTPVIQENIKEEVDEVVEEVVEEAPKKDVPTKPVTNKQSNYTIKFSYGYYKGETLNGKMHGYGTLYFNQQQVISTKDPKNRIADRGDYVSGTWYNGFLDQGKWFSENGEQKGHIIIGH